MQGYHRIVVRCVETGEEWQSAKDCATAIDVKQNLLYEHIRFKDPINNKHYIKL